MTVSVSDLTVGCADHAELYQHPLMEDDPGRAASPEQRRMRTALTRRAAAICGGCDHMEACLYRAVVDHDVAGFVAGTTENQRKRMRTLLSLTVRPDDLDAASGSPTVGHQVNHAEIVRLRAQNPHMSLDTIAQRLGCSLSTVKRHLRRARAEASAGRLHDHRPSVQLPSPSEVLTAREMVMPRRRRRTATVDHGEVRPESAEIEVETVEVEMAEAADAAVEVAA